MNNEFVRCYLELLNMPSDYSAQSVHCELCGSEEYELLLSRIQGPQDKRVNLPVVGCKQCGHIFQLYRFEAKFYQDYYDKYYRLNLFGDSEPDKLFFLDQVKRGDYLFKSLRPWLPQNGNLLDVGCSAGGLMIPFAKRGWKVKGNDPDSSFARYGRQLGLDIESINAESMPIDWPTDLIIINGSLEHVYDINLVLSKCKAMSNENGLLLIEGRALGYGIQQGYLTHNHRRFLSGESISHLMLKHGWTPLLVTDEPLCGPTRPGAVFVLARLAEIDNAAIEKIRVRGKDRLAQDFRTCFASWDAV